MDSRLLTVEVGVAWAAAMVGGAESPEWYHSCDGDAKGSQTCLSSLCSRKDPLLSFGGTAVLVPEDGSGETGGGSLVEVA